MKKLIFLLFAFLIALSSCSIAGEKVISYGDTEISENIFFFELCYRKTNFLNSVLGMSSDNELIWSQSAGETSLDEAIKNITLEECCKLAFFSQWAKDNGYALTDGEKAAVQETLANMEGQFENRAALNLYFEPYSMNYDLYEEYCTLQMLAQKGMAYYYSQGGADPISEEEMEELYKNMFITVKHIFISTEAAGVDAQGNVVKLTEEQKAEKLALVSSIEAALNAGMSFDEYYSLSEDGMKESYPDGYTITQGVMGMAEYERAAFELEVGEYCRIDVEGVGTYFIKRIETSEADFANCYSYILQMLVQTRSSLLMETLADEFEINHDILANYTTAGAPLIN